jgi:GNAT superfamily N-acetyltransferase
LNWASWLRMHCQDPTWEQHVIKAESSTEMRFERWNSLQSWNGIADIKIIDTTQLSLDHVAKQISRYTQLQSLGIKIKQLSQDDIKPLSDAFLKENYNKTQELFSNYLQEQNDLKRTIWVVLDNKNHYLGYITIIWHSSYTYFAENNIPEINDFNVLPSKQERGIGTYLIQHVEKIAAKKYSQIDLGVGLFEDYGCAQRLYIKRGYMPNKEGITYKLQTVKPFTAYPIDDDCLLWLTKNLSGKIDES